MSLAWTTIAVVVLLLPGFFFFPGLYTPERFSRDAGPQSPATQLAATVTVALLIHAALYLVNRPICGPFVPCIRLDYVFALLQLEGAKAYSLKDLASEIDQFGAWIFMYFLLASASGFGFGFSLGTASLKFPVLAKLSRHGWFLDLFGDRKSRYVYAYVLTQVEHEGSILLYRGVLKEIYLSKEGAISYLVLTAPMRYYMKLDKDGASTTPPEKWAAIGTSHPAGDSGGTEATYLVIKGEETSNVVFEKKLFALPKVLPPELADDPELPEEHRPTYY